MTRKLSVGITWQFDMKREDAIALAKIADECGIDSFWVPEGWARDAFSLLISIAEKTERLKLATGIVNVYSRTPGALAQQFATLDETGVQAVVTARVEGSVTNGRLQEITGAFIVAFILLKSGVLNSSQSVEITSASAPFSVS